MVDRSSAILLITAFFTLILGVVLLTSIAESEQGLVTKDSTENESITFAQCRDAEMTINDTGCNKTLTNAPTGWKLDDDKDACPLTAFTLKNCTGDTLTIATHYTVGLSTGVVEMRNVTNTICNVTSGTLLENNTFAGYSYCPDDYLTQSWNRTLMDVVVGFFGLALMIISVGLFYMIARKEGIIGI